MRRFNPEKELSKIKNGNKKKVIISICALLVVGVLGYSFALYQVRHTKSLVYTTVSDFKKRDIYLSVLVDGKTQGDFPKNNEGKIYSGIECDKPYSEAYFDNTEWKLHFTSEGPNKCTVKFETGNLPNAPELYQGMIPVVYGKNGLMYVADTNSDWYNYQDHRWANAVLVDASQANIKSKYFKEDNTLRDDIAGKEVPMEEVLQMYVWIPRYKYQLWNANNESKPKQLINIKFEAGTESTGDIKCTYTNNNDGTITEDCINKNTNAKVQNGEWYTHPSFTFGDTQLKGIWVGKFEPSDAKDPNGRTRDTIQEISILPNKTSMIWKNINSITKATRNIELQTSSKYNLDSTKIDTHMMKSIDWGAVAYLTQSIYGIYKDEKTCNIEGMDFTSCRVWINNTAQGTGTAGGTNIAYGGTATGCAGTTATDATEWNDDASTPAKCPIGRRWNENGAKASTTGNMYGVYDMSGGTTEEVFGIAVTQNGEIKLERIGITDSLDNKYFNIYSYRVSGQEIINDGILGDALSETRGWNGIVYPHDSPNGENITSISRRGDRYQGAVATHIFGSGSEAYLGALYTSFRTVLTAQDGID